MPKNLVKNLIFHIQKRFLQSSLTLSSTPTLPTRGTSSSSSFTVEYLVKSCGLPLRSALSVSQKCEIDEENPEKVQSILEFLKSHNFSGTQVAKLIVKRPQILKSKIEGNLQRKFDYFTKIGFGGKLLPELIVSNPVLLKRSLDSQIKPSFEFLRSFIVDYDKIQFAIKRSSWLLTSDLKVTVQPNIDLLKQKGVPVKVLGRLIAAHPRTLLQSHERMAYTVGAVMKLGFIPNTPMFVHALRAMISMSESTWKKKFEVLKSVGFNEEGILSAFKRDPLVLSCSEKKIRTAMDFYINTVKLDPHVVISYPKLLMYAIERRMRPRYNVLKVLESKKLVPKLNKQTAWLVINEENFLKKYVLKYMVEAPGLVEMYPGAEKFLRKLIEKFKGDVPASVGDAS